MTSNILKFPVQGDTVDRLLDEARAAGLEEAIVIGWKTEGGFYLSGSSMRADAALAALKIAEVMIMDALMEET